LGNTIAGNGFGKVTMGDSGPAPELGNPGKFVSPWLNQQGDNIANRTNQMLGQNLAGIQGQSVASGGLGGSRQGVAQGTAMGQAADYMSGNLANMYGTAWDNAANRGIQKYGIDSNMYNQGQNRNLEQYQGDQQFYGQQRGQDLLGATTGANLVNSGLNTQWLPLQNAGNIYSQFSGQGTTTNNSSSGGGWLSALGGAMSGYALGNYFK
jgi:hypothetical protein